MNALLVSTMPTFGNHVSHIVGDCSQKQVGRVHAWRVVAAMQNPQSIGYFSICQFARKAMRVHPTRSARVTEFPIACWSTRALPLLTALLVSPIDSCPDGALDSGDRTFAAHFGHTIRAIPAVLIDTFLPVGVRLRVEGVAGQRSFARSAHDEKARSLRCSGAVRHDGNTLAAAKTLNRLCGILRNEDKRYAALFAHTRNFDRLSGHSADLLDRSVGCHDRGRSNAARSFAARNYTGLAVP